MLVEDDGFTLLELLIVVVVISILVAIAVPAYGGLRDRAGDRAAEHALHETLVASNAYAVDHDGFSSLTLKILRRDYDPEIPASVTLGRHKAGYVCLKIVSASGSTYWLRGPEGIETVGTKKADRPAGC